jgi:hypothetical protein
VTSNETWRRYLDVGAAVGQVTLARAEEIARGLLAPEEAARQSAWRDLDDLGRTSRVIGGQLVELARRELTEQVKTIGSFDELVDRIAEVLGQPRPPSGPEPAARHDDVGSATGEPQGATSQIRQPTAEEVPPAVDDLYSPDAEHGKKHNKNQKKQKAAKNKKKHSTLAKAKSEAKKNKKGKSTGSEHRHNGAAASQATSSRVLTLAKPLDSLGRP